MFISWAESTLADAPRDISLFNCVPWQVVDNMLYNLELGAFAVVVVSEVLSFLKAFTSISIVNFKLCYPD